MTIEWIFLGMLVIFAITGIVHGYRQELGVTIVLLLALCLLEITEGHFAAQFTAMLNWAISGNAIYREAMRGVLYCGLLVLAVFFAYQTDFLRFPGKDFEPIAPVLSASSGVLNGYLLAGSMWYYLGHAGWPFTATSGPFSQTYWSVWQLLPPHLLPWPLLVLAALLMLFVRMWR